MTLSLWQPKAAVNRPACCTVSFRELHNSLKPYFRKKAVAYVKNQLTTLNVKPSVATEILLAFSFCFRGDSTMADAWGLDVYKRWYSWHLHAKLYGHLYRTGLEIPVPPAAGQLMEKYTTDDPKFISQMDALLERLKREGYQMPPPPPSGPPSNLASRAYNIGKSEPSMGKAAAKGAWEGVKSSGAGGMLVRGLLGALTKRR